jgi:hypothetical protein
VAEAVAAADEGARSRAAVLVPRRQPAARRSR